MATVKLKLRGRGRKYSLLVGIAAGALLTGLAVPFMLGDRPSDRGRAATGAREGGRSSGVRALDEGVPPANTGATADPAEQTAGAASPTVTIDGTRLTASDRGVTPTTIKIGVLLSDLGNLSEIGVDVPSVSPEQQREAYEIYLNEVNKAGGVLGRRITPVYKAYDVFSADSMRAACLALTRDAQVFAVVGGNVFGPSLLCFTEEHRTPLMMLGSLGVPAGYFERSGGYMFTIFESGLRAMANLVGELDAQGMLTKTTIGILEDDGGDPGGHTVSQGAVATLKQLGHKVAYRARLSADANVAASQIPVAVQQMRTHGVDTVLLFTGFLQSTQFVQQADSQRWHPRYFTSDWQSMYSDVAVEGMPPSFDGSLVLTSTLNNDWRLNRPEPEYDAKCRQRWEQATGEKLDRTETAYQTTLRICTIVEMFASAAANAGPSLTRDAWSASMQSVGRFPLATFAGGAFGRGKFDAADVFRFMEYQSGCRCWMPSSDFKPGRY